MKTTFKLMKKLWLIVGLCVIGLVSNAQNHLSQSFISEGISSITLSNLVSPTNLLSTTSWGTNVAGLTFTNMGSRVVVTNGYVADGATNSWGGTINVLSDQVALWSDREGRPYSQATTNVTAPGLFSTPAAIMIKTTANSGANAAITFTFAPVYDGVEESTGVGNAWVWSFTPTASSTQVYTTNAPMYQWPGCKGLRLLRVVNTDTDASSDVQLLKCKLVGFRP